VSILAVVGSVSLYFFNKYFEEKKEAQIKAQTKTVGTAAIGGPFTLLDVEGKEVTEKHFLGKHTLIYFGFTFCPDICPRELTKATFPHPSTTTTATTAPWK
jgi:protein SCO1/2